MIDKKTKEAILYTAKEKIFASYPSKEELWKESKYFNIFEAVLSYEDLEEILNNI